MDELKDPGLMEFARQASIQEGEGYADRELGYALVSQWLVGDEALESLPFEQLHDVVGLPLDLAEVVRPWDRIPCRRLYRVWRR